MKILLVLLIVCPFLAFSQDLETVTQNGNSTTLGINVAGNSSIRGVNFSLANEWTKQIVPSGYNLWISNGATDGRLILPFTSTSNARFQDFGLIVDKNLGVGTDVPADKLDVKGIFRISGENRSWRMLSHLTDGNLYFRDENSQSMIMTFGSNGNVGIGTIQPNEKLAVNGNIRAKEIKVETTNWPDYVFEKDYKKLSLAELEKFIQLNKHLPEMPPAGTIESNGLAVGDMIKLQQKKIEELTLHLIEKDKVISTLIKRMDAFEQSVKSTKN